MNRHLITVHHPASWHGELWRDALFLGNGLSGILMQGAIAEETIRCNRFDLWHGGNPGGEIPDISDTFRDMRAQILAGQYTEANTNRMAAALAEKGYRCAPEVPHPLGNLKIKTEPETIFKDYSRGIDLRRAEGFVKYRIGETEYSRRVFVSRKRDLVVFLMEADKPFTAAYRFDVFRADGREAAESLTPDTIDARTTDNAYGAKIRFAGEYTAVVENNRVYVTGSRYLVLMRLWSGEEAEPDIEGFSYEDLLEEHTALYTPLYDAVSLELAAEEEPEADTETLLAEAYQDAASPALLEKMWRFGRYLFISAFSEKGYPVPLYGLWHGDDNMPWSQYVANENVQMTYWHTLTGGLAEALRPLIRFYTDKTESLRECAKKLFGCEGIWLSAYTTPNVSGPCVPVGVIINWISGAGWISRHFWDCYRYTGDPELLKDEILPFMREAALFFRDYVTTDADGNTMLVPSVSPENTPGNLIPPYFTENMGHIAPAVKNAAMDFAVMKELLTHLLTAIDITGLYTEEREGWQALLDSIPPYQINGDGALAEWIAEDLDDHYYHRHLSHIYPLFPGEEIDSRRTPEWFEACRKAVHLRKLGGQSGWSLTHMANIYARLGEGENAVQCLDILTKSAVNNALVTTHNDWRHMGMTLDLENFAPVQLDANFGLVSALQEMLFCPMEGALFLLPALPDRMKAGCAKGLCFPEGTVDLDWNETGVVAHIHARKPYTAEVFVRGKSAGTVNLAARESTVIRI
ncbi:MAG: glycoside hydrolase N-terminal domain-containing protein [Clostridia bacterium]|nr:glycoside hydrolase N-terminal domain-containing protein [Clostridia bacterium]